VFRRDDIAKLLRAQPFQPFRILTTDGKTYDIRSPDFLSAGNSQLHVVDEDKVRRGEPDDWEFVAMVHVVKIIPLETETPQPAGGT
jgi:hypothetical protein